MLTFAVFAVIARNDDGHTTLDTTRVFTSLSLFALLTDPLSTLIMSVSTFAGSAGCFERIQAFLKTDEQQDKRERPMLLASSDAYQSSTFSNSRESDLKSLKLSSCKESDRFSEKTKSHTTTDKRCDPIPAEIAIAVRAASFGWEEEKGPLLQSIDIDIPKEKLTLLLGPVGCGKSTLLKAILGEISPTEGQIQMSSSSIAYCDQSPWHTSNTIQQAIIAFCDFDERWYQTVIRACALGDDFRQLPRGDQTMVGSKGIALSGGQSQRVVSSHHQLSLDYPLISQKALARAVYARKEIVILDDVLSGLDVETESKVFDNLLGQHGLFRQMHATVIMASSSGEYTSVLSLTHNLLVIFS